MEDRRLTLRQEITNAICEGFREGGNTITDVQVTEDYTDIYVGDNEEPVRVTAGLKEPPDVIVPDSLAAAKLGIYLDVRTILADL